MSHLRRLDHALGRLYFRAIGLLVAAFTLGAGWMAWGALRTGSPGAALLMATIAAGAAALARHCFSPARRLTDIED